jgi:hypothetical protein
MLSIAVNTPTIAMIPKAIISIVNIARIRLFLTAFKASRIFSVQIITVKLQGILPKGGRNSFDCRLALKYFQKMWVLHKRIGVFHKKWPVKSVLLGFSL